MVGSDWMNVEIKKETVNIELIIIEFRMTTMVDEVEDEFHTLMTIKLSTILKVICPLSPLEFN